MKEHRLVNHCISDNSYENPPSRKYPFIGARPGRGCRTAITARTRDLLQRRNWQISGMRATIATISGKKLQNGNSPTPAPGRKNHAPEGLQAARVPGGGGPGTPASCPGHRHRAQDRKKDRIFQHIQACTPLRNMSAAVSRIAVILPRQEYEQRKDRPSRPCCCSGAENRP